MAVSAGTPPAGDRGNSCQHYFRLWKLGNFSELTFPFQSKMLHLRNKHDVLQSDNVAPSTKPPEIPAININESTEDVKH